MSLDVTIAMTLRETTSPTIASMESLVKYTPTDVKIVFVASGLSEDILGKVEKIAADRDLNILYRETYLTPNQARNLALQEVDTRYVAYVDNDVIFSENWLEPLVRCAEEEGAAIVGPVIYERFPPFRFIHLAGGVADVHVQEDGSRHYYEKHNYQHYDTDGKVPDLTRVETSLVEFHAILVETALLKEMGGLDEDLLSYSEHWDLCMEAQKLGKKIFFEPESRVTYLPPLEPTEEDLRFFDLRWSNEWYRKSIDRLVDKYALTPGEGSLRYTDGFMRNHRLHRYGRLRKRLSKIVGTRLSNAFMTRIVARWDAVNRSKAFREDYLQWKAYTRESGHG